jgi:hypothetical protein
MILRGVRSGGKFVVSREGKRTIDTPEVQIGNSTYANQ